MRTVSRTSSSSLLLLRGGGRKLVAAAATIVAASTSFPATAHAAGAFTPPNPFGRTALVLAGGGAKGAYTVGVLETICKSSELANSWDLVTGTSIGAMNAAALAQFKKKDQCGKGIPAMKTFWTSVKKLSDVFTSNSGDGAECPSTYDALSAASSFFSNGGMCSSDVGEANLRKAINVADIAKSDVELQVVATNLRTGDSTWWNGDDPKIFEGVMASAAISPVAKPRYAEYEEAATGRRRTDYFVDGGLLHNAPLLRALERGASKAIVVLLDPAESPGIDVVGIKANETDRLGGMVLYFYWQVIQSQLFLHGELESACKDFPTAEIVGYIPNGTVGGILDFNEPAIDKMMAKGAYEAATVGGPIDLCAAYGLSRGKVPA